MNRVVTCQFPNCDLFTSLALLSSFGRETSLVKITWPRSIFTLLFTPTIYFQFYFPLHSYLLPWSFVNSKAEGIDNSSVLVGSKVICFCVQVHNNSLAWSNFWRRFHLLVSLESYWSITLVSSPREICCYATSHLPLGVTNEKWENYHPHRIKLISGVVAGDSSLQDRGVGH